MSDETRLNELLDRWEELRNRGMMPTAEQVCVDHPELADELQRRIAALRIMDVRLAYAGGPTADPAPPPGQRSSAPPVVLPAESPYLRLRFHAARRPG